MILIYPTITISQYQCTYQYHNLMLSQDHVQEPYCQEGSSHLSQSYDLYAPSPILLHPLAADQILRLYNAAFYGSNIWKFNSEEDQNFEKLGTLTS